MLVVAAARDPAIVASKAKNYKREGPPQSRRSVRLASPRRRRPPDEPPPPTTQPFADTRVQQPQRAGRSMAWGKSPASERRFPGLRHGLAGLRAGERRRRHKHGPSV